MIFFSPLILDLKIITAFQGAMNHCIFVNMVIHGISAGLALASCFAVKLQAGLARGLRKQDT